LRNYTIQNVKNLDSVKAVFANATIPHRRNVGITEGRKLEARRVGCSLATRHSTMFHEYLRSCCEVIAESRDGWNMMRYEGVTRFCCCFYEYLIMKYLEKE
jgi:hypothetical protein